MAWYMARNNPDLQRTPGQAVAVLQRPKSGRPEPKPIGSKRGRDVPSAYQELADSIGFQGASLSLNDQIHNFLVEQCIPIYNTREVSRFMTRLAAKNNANFFWRPLRQIDADVMGTWGWGFGNAHDYYSRQDKVCTPYDKAVPIHILHDAKLVIDRFGQKVALFVTDYKANSPDPFIMVTAPDDNTDRFVFGAWDEPGFGAV